MIDMYQCPCLLELGTQIINELNHNSGGGSPPTLRSLKYLFPASNGITL